MNSNFDFLKTNWRFLFDDAFESESNVRTSPRTSLFYSRRCLEAAVKWMYSYDNCLDEPYKKNLSAMIHEPSFCELLAPGLFNQVRLIQKAGNMAVHSLSKPTEIEAVQVCRALQFFLGWMVRLYSSVPPQLPQFDESFIPEKGVGSQSLSLADIQKLRDKLAASDEKIKEQKALSDQEIAELKSKINEYKQANSASLPQTDYTETQTRSLFIDLLLKESGWDPQGYNAAEYPVTGMPTPTGKGFVDYVLWGKDGLPLAVVEAKKTKIDPAQGRQQAKLYADCLENITGQRPIIFYSNGYETWLWDDLNYPPRLVQGFYSLDELQLLINRRQHKTSIIQAKINKDITGRYYQREAIQRVAEHFEQDNARQALLVMATGTGKTRVSISIVDILMRCDWAKRILFLADRKALVRQAKRAFNKFLPNVSVVNLLEEKEDVNSRVVFSTYPTMMNMIDEESENGQKRFGAGFFDLVIIDEAHRSVYQKYRAIFEYFDSLLLGLTATPTAEVDHNTYQLFNLEDHVPTYAYELEQAVDDGYLIPFCPFIVPMEFDRKGITYDKLSPQEKEEYESKFFDEDTNTLPDKIEPAALNKWLFNKDTVDKVLRHLMEHGIKVEGGDKLGKTIIFAKNHKHAVFIEERFNHNYPHLKGSFLRVIDNQEVYAESLIDEFSLKYSDPVIAVSVDMLDTGIDVEEIVNLVFFKIVRSKTKFWQMIGRGTRLCPDLFEPGRDKKEFCIFDFCDNFEFFKANPQGYKILQQEPLKQKIFKRRLAIVDFLNKTSMDSKPSLYELLLDAMHSEVAKMNVDNFIVRPHRRFVEKYSERQAWDELKLTDIADISDHLTGLPVEDRDDEFARRFDLLCLNMQLFMLETNPMQQQCMENIRMIASALEEKNSIPAVAFQMELILEIQNDEFWENVTVDIVEDVRTALRYLIKFIDADKKQQNIYTDFEDTILEDGPGKIMEGFIKADPALEYYRQKVEVFIKKHQEHQTIKKLKNNKLITAADIKDLEDILFGEGGACTRQQYEQAYGNDEPLGVLIRKIVGLDRNAAKEVFSTYIDSGDLNANQIRFIDMIIDHLSVNGVIEPSVLFSPPFTDMHDHGISGVLPELAAQIVETIETINKNAEAA